MYVCFHAHMMPVNMKKMDTHFKFSIVWGQFQLIKKTKCWYRNRRI